MSDDLRITTVKSETTQQSGRSLNHARDQHYVIDEPAFAGGPGEAVTPEESFLTGVSACGVSLVESFADEKNYSLSKAHCEIRGVRAEDNPADYKRVEMEFELHGVTEDVGNELVEAYKDR
ncbi:MAG: OsmC family protein [bacterium]